MNTDNSYRRGALPILLSLLCLGMIPLVANGQVNLSDPSRADCGPEEFEFQKLTVAGIEVGCVAHFQDLDNGHAAILTCVRDKEPKPDESGFEAACIDHWQILNLGTGKSFRLEAPEFDEYFSAPSFHGELLAYWGLHRLYENAPLTAYAMVYHWKSKRLLRHAWAGVVGMETDAREYLPAPVWSIRGKNLIVRFDLSAMDFSYELKEVIIELPQSLLEPIGESNGVNR